MAEAKTTHVVAAHMSYSCGLHHGLEGSLGGKLRQLQSDPEDTKPALLDRWSCIR